MKLHHGDCREILKTLPSCSVDSIVTDPPYEIGFMGKAWDSQGIAYDPAIWSECLRVLKPGGHILAFSSPRTAHRMICAIEDAGFEIRDQLLWLFGCGLPKSLNLHGEWEGWGTNLKPAYEPIVLARKPLPGKIEDNVKAHGTGAIHINACRLTDDEIIDAIWPDAPKPRQGELTADKTYAGDGVTDFAMKPGPRGGDPAGRWPANVLHDGSDEVLEAFKKYGDHAAGGKVKGTEPSSTGSNGIYDLYGRVESQPYMDSGTVDRFFYCAKATKEDREEGLESLVRRQQDASRKEGNPGGDNPRNRGLKPRLNDHPTVKPTKLMRWLVRLITPPGGTVLDPFMGSGSTGKATELEKFDFIGIEIDAGHVEKAFLRIEHVKPKAFQLGAPGRPLMTTPPLTKIAEGDSAHG